MTITVIAGERRKRVGGEWAKQALSQSTATAFQVVNLYIDRVHVGMGTATGFGLNRYALATGAEEGKVVSFLATATGEAKVHLGGGTATGLWVLSTADTYMRIIYEDDKWRLLTNSGATQATAT